MFKSVATFFGAEENPVTKFSNSEFRAIKKIMEEKRSDLTLQCEFSWPLSQSKNIGLVVPEGTGIMSILHAEGNLCKAYEEVTGRPLEKENIKKYKPIPVESMHFPIM